MIRRRKPEWQRLISGLYVPPLLHFGDPYPCPNCCEECPHCIDGNIPNQIDVTVSGVLEDTCSGNCIRDLDAKTFTTNWLEESDGICYWRYTLDPVICNLLHVDVRVSATDILVYWTPVTGILPYPTWTKVVDAPHDCMNWTDLDLPYSGGVIWPGCDVTSTTCKITSL